MSSLSIYLFLFYLCATSIDGANILAIFPSQLQQSYMVAEPLLKELHSRGHNLTVISPFPQNQSLVNFHDIKVGDRQTVDLPLYSNMNLFTSKFDANKWNSQLEYLRNITFDVLKNSEVQALMSASKVQFDIVLVEVMLAEALYAFAPFFRAHLVGLSMRGTDSSIDRLVGNISPLSYIPISTAQGLPSQLTFTQRIYNVLVSCARIYSGDLMDITKQGEIYKQYFPNLGDSLPSITENFSLVLLNQHFTLGSPRPYVPNMVEVGGLYVPAQPSPLAPDIADFIDGAEFGVIYCAMGALTHKYEKEKLRIILALFSKRKERVLFKHGTNETSTPKNVLIRPWFNQTDILAHPKVKVFITHGGYLSVLEAIHFAKPMIGWTKAEDHVYNLLHAVKQGFAISMPYEHVSKDNLDAALDRVLVSSNSFTEAAQKMSKRFHDKPAKPLDEAVYWIEYILRHKGAPHMRVLSGKLWLYQLLNLDLYAFVQIMSLGSLFLFIGTVIQCRCYALALWHYMADEPEPSPEQREIEHIQQRLSELRTRFLQSRRTIRRFLETPESGRDAG